MSLAPHRRRVSCGLLGNVGVMGHGFLGCPGPAFGLSSPFCFSALSISCAAASPSQLFSTLRAGHRSLCCGVRLALQRRYRTCVSGSGVLQQTFCDSQSHRRLEASYRPFASQPLCSPFPVLHGNFGFCPPIALPRQLDGFFSSTGCLPPSPCPSGLSEVSAFLRGCRSFSIQSPVFWAFFGSSSLHPGHGSGLLYYASVWVQDPPLPGRLARPRILVPGDHAGEGLSALALRSVGYSRQSFQEYPHSISTVGLSRHDAAVEPFDGFSDTGSCAEGTLSRYRIRVLTAAAARSLALPSEGHVFSLDGGSRLQALCAFLPAPRADCGASSPRGRADFLGRLLPPGSSVVVRCCSSGGRGSSGPSTSISHIVHRRLGHRLGCIPRLGTPIRLVVSELYSLFDQPPGASGDLPGSGWFQSAPSSPVRGSIHRQYHCFVLPTEGRGDTVVHPQLSSSGDPPVLRGQSICLLPQFIPGKLNVLADALSRSSQVLGS